VRNLTFKPLRAFQRPQLAPHRFRGVQARCWIFICVACALGAVLVSVGARIDGGAVAVLSFAPLFWCLDRRYFPELYIGPFMMMYSLHLLGYAVSPLWEIHVIGKLSAIEEGLAPAQWGGALGLATIAAVFPPVFQQIVKRRGVRASGLSFGQRGSSWKTYSMLLLLAGVTIVGYGFLSGTANRLNGASNASIASSSLVSAFSSVPLIMFYFLARFAARLRRFWLLLWSLVLCGFATLYTLDGSRGIVAMAVLVSLLGLVSGGLSRRKATLALLAGVVVLVPLAGIVRVYRDSATLNATTLSGRMSGFRSALEEFTETRSSVAGSTEAAAWSLTAKSVDLVFLNVPSVIPYSGLEGIGSVWYSLTPRILNPDRPDLLDGNALAIEYGGARKNTTGGSYMPAVGDGYRRFGWPGIAGLYSVLSVSYACVFALCWRNRNRCDFHGDVCLPFYSAPMEYGLLTLYSAIYTFAWIIPRTFFIFWLFGLLVRFRHHRAAYTPSLTARTSLCRPFIRTQGAD
jgi:hypothetical protein